MFGKDFPQPNCLNVVITTDKNLLGKSLDGALFTDKSPKEIVEMATIKGFRKLFLVGGEKINSSFLKDNLIDQIWTNIHPLLLLCLFMIYSFFLVFNPDFLSRIDQYYP